MSDDAPPRPVEMEVMAKLERILLLVEEAQGYIQDDSRISGPSDVRAIRERMFGIRVLTVEIESLLRSP